MAKFLIVLGDGMALDLDHQVVIKDGLRIALSNIDFRLLRHLALHLGAVVTFNDLWLAGWGTADGLTRHELHVYVQRLRRRIEDNPRAPTCLITVYRIGYMLRPRTAGESPLG